MTFEEKKEEYARLIVKAGAHVRKGQKVNLTCPIECYDFGRMIVKYAYEEGASEVSVHWDDDVCARLKFDYAPMEVFEHFPEWRALELNSDAKNDAAFIHLVGSDPEAFKGVDRNKQKASRVASHEALKDYYKLQSTMGFKWNVSAVPTIAWAKKVFPDLNESVALTRLWDAIFAACRVGEGDAYERWMQHADDLHEKCEKLTAWQFTALHYSNSLGTDFWVGLAENHRFEGGADLDKKDGGRFFANIPTEEAFTMPDNRKAEGKLVASMPLSYSGNLIENFWFEFRDGAVIDYGAEKGQETLKMLLDSDEGSRRLGECALVPYPSPVSSQGILFLETLFDENAACHFALGACYETNIQGGPEMSEEELHAHGGNTSMNHVDFMVGTADLKITGITKDGEEVTVFENGTWAF